MNNRKFQTIYSIAKLFRSVGSHVIEHNLSTQKKAEAFYTSTPMPRV